MLRSLLRFKSECGEFRDESLHECYLERRGRNAGVHDNGGVIGSIREEAVGDRDVMV